MCSSQNIESMPWKEDTQWTSKKASQTRMEPMKHNIVLILINIFKKIQRFRFGTSWFEFGP